MSDRAPSPDRAPAPAGTTPFHDVADFVALPRVGGLALSPDGERLVVGVSTIEPRKRRSYVTALWEVDPSGRRPARRLTRGTTGESAAAFTPSGDLLFTAARPGVDPDAPEDGDADENTALWLLPGDGGDARVLARRPGGTGAFQVARESGTLVLAAATLPSATDEESETEGRKARTDAGVRAILHEAYPVRYWDHDLGPDRLRLFTAETDALGASAPGEPEVTLDLRDLTGHVGGRLHDTSGWDVSEDGRTVVVEWVVPEPMAGQRPTLVAVDVATGERTVLADDDRYEFDQGRISPDGSRVALVRCRRVTPDSPPDVDLALVPTVGGAEPQVLAEGWDRWPKEVRWTRDGDALVVTADSDGRGPIYRVDASTGEVTALTHDDATYTDVVVAPDGAHVVALRTSYAGPPHPVRVALDGSGVEVLPSPVSPPELPGRLAEVTTTAQDGTPLRAWLALPHDASPERPAPTLLWIHGGPLGSWNAWTWRWCPWVMVARGYAVLLPDPALSTGYGRDFVARGWGGWGGTPFRDLMTLTDAALERDDLDAERTAAMGGSFGGYMANWVAGHTDRFRAIVSHASLWALDQFAPTTDAADYWARSMTPAMSLQNSPHQHVDQIDSPMLVIHGDLDYRVPIGEAVRLWWDLLSRSKELDGRTPHRFLYFPDENHWILAPGNARVWYDTVLAFLDQHVLGQEWRRPELLG